MHTQIHVSEMHAWTDSLVVLSWLTVPHEVFKQYISNRVHQIQTLLPECQWHHVKSEENPADCASRGLMPSALPNHRLYGPPFLLTPPHEWGRDIERLPWAELPELKDPAPVVCVAELASEWFTRFSSFDRLIRVIARIFRFVKGCRRQPVGPTHILRRAELDAARRAVIISAQYSAFFADLELGNRIVKTARPAVSLNRPG